MGVRRGEGAGFVGRGAETGVVQEALAALEDGVGGLIQVVGEPGIGKTRLLGVVRDLAVARGFRVASGRTSGFDGGMPFQVLVEALQELIGPDQGPDSPGEVEVTAHSRFPVFQALRQTLLTLASRPLVMLLDDVHWADPDSIDFLVYLSRRPIPAPLLLVIAHRGRQTPPRLRYALARAADHDGHTRIELDPLSRSEAAELVGVRAGSARAKELYLGSGGNPLYLLTLAQDEKRAAGSAWDTLPGTGSVGRLEPLVLGEIMALSPWERTVAEAAAVLGDPFSAADLAEVVACSPHYGAGGCLTHSGDVEAKLATLIDRDLIRPVAAGPSFAFRHPLVRRVVYDNTPSAWQAAVHRSVLRAKTCDGTPADVMAGHIERCVDTYSPEHFAVLIQAGQDATPTAPLTAAHWFQVALRLLPQTSGFADVRRRTEAGLARALGLGGRFEASRVLVQGLVSGDAAEEGFERSENVWMLAHVEQRLGRYPEALALLRAEVARSAEAPVPGRVKLCLELGLTALLADDYPSARADVAWALDAARAAGDVVGEATALALGAFGESCAGESGGGESGGGESGGGESRAVESRAGESRADQCNGSRLAEISTMADRAGALVDALPDSALAAERETLCLLGWAEFLLERFADAERHLARARAVIGRTDHRHGLPHVLLGQALVDLFVGRLTRSLERAEEAEDAARDVDSQHLLGVALAVKALILLHRTRPGGDDAALAAVRRASEMVGGGGAGSWFGRNALMVLGCVEPWAGDVRAYVDRAVRVGGPDLRLLGAPLVPQYCEALVRGLIKLGNLKRAAAFVALASRTAEGLGLPGQSAHAARARGLLAAAHGEQERAVAEFAAAEAGFAASGKALELARTQAVSAAVRRPGARDRYATGHSAHHDPTHRTPSTTALSALTLREREVAHLVSTGRSNRQIATRLRLSERTVESHLANVYRKLGVASRVTLTRMLAVDHQASPAR